MSRLTLKWHLRGIVKGTTEPKLVRQDIEWNDSLDRWDKAKRYYADPNVENNNEQRAHHKASSYTTGHTQESGDFCDVFDVLAPQALNSDDPVQFLDRIAQDPTRSAQQRHDAAQLLNYHIWPDAPDAGILGRSESLCGHCDRPDIEFKEWSDAKMNRRKTNPTYLEAKCVNPKCTEMECLANPDILRDEGRAECMACGTNQPIPDYP